MVVAGGEKWMAGEVAKIWEGEMGQDLSQQKSFEL